VVGPGGLPRNIKIARSLSPEFDAAAIDAVKKWKFDPATKDGNPVAVQINVELTFRLK
jgi:TonB family protein